MNEARKAHKILKIQQRNFFKITTLRIPGTPTESKTSYKMKLEKNKDLKDSLDPTENKMSYGFLVSSSISK